MKIYNMNKARVETSPRIIEMLSKSRKDVEEGKLIDLRFAKYMEEGIDFEEIISKLEITEINGKKLYSITSFRIAISEIDIKVMKCMEILEDLGYYPNHILDHM